ncbi:MAG: 5-oxoprolinase subunit PxpA [Flavobacteriaceae bacterium]|nr:5-oxoprolinase subunit PxpA [Flavobacteriaceae bacterium]
MDTYQIDINCDLGEGLNNEGELMPYISSCSIACGGHAGSKRTIKKVIDLALKHHVKIGAHPSFPDKANFGRIRLEMPLNQLQQSIEEQIQLVIRLCEEKNTTLHHIKPHGALYNLAAIDSFHAEIVINAVKNVAPQAFLYVPYNSILQHLAEKAGIKIKIEAFADRNYNTDLTLVSRKSENAVITDKEKLVRHLLKMTLEKKVKTINGVEVRMEAETFCFHGDNPKAIELLKYASKELQKKGIKIV